MAKAGRKRKQGARYPSGKLRPAYDKGSDWVQGQHEKYGTHYSTALGRAYAAGLLGDEDHDGLARYQAGKRFVRIYSRFIGGEAYRCPLDQTPRGSNIVDFEANDQDQRDHDWLHRVMDELDEAGVRPWLDQLISRQHTDHGPCWLDRLLAKGKHPADRMMMDSAIRALDILAPTPTQPRIVVQHY